MPNHETRVRTALILAATLAGTVVPTSAVEIDDFSVGQGPLILAMCPDGPTSSSALGGLGGERDIELSCSGTGTALVVVGSGFLDFSSDPPGSLPLAVVQWDGSDGSAALDATGLGGLDLTSGSQDTLRLRLETDPNPLTVSVEVYTDAANSSICTIVVPPSSDRDFGLGFPGDMPDCTFTVSLGTGADFSNVGAIVMTLDGGGFLDARIDFLRTDAGPVPVTLQGFSVE